MRILLADPLACTDDFEAALRRLCPNATTFRWPQMPRDGRYEMLLAWRLPDEAAMLPDSVRLVFCFGAGADHLLNDPRIPEHLPIARLVDRDQAQQILDYAVHVVFARLADEAGRRRDQKNGVWRPPAGPNRSRCDIRVTILGLGPIGRYVADGLATLGFRVSAWSRAPRPAADFQTYSGIDGLHEAVAGADVLINLLPLKPETEGILAQSVFEKLAPGAYLVNLGRGGHLDENALQAALASGRLGAAWLDAFRQEPLPTSHWFWRHENVRVTPHAAGLPTAEGAARSLARLISCMEAGEPLPGLVRPAAT